MPRVPLYAPNQVGSVSLPPINPMASAADYSMENITHFGNMGNAIDGTINNFQEQARKEQLKLDSDYARDSLNNTQLQIGKFLIDAQQRSPKENINLDMELDGMFKNQYEQATKGMNPQQKELFTPSFDQYASDYMLKAYQLKTNAKEQFNVSTVTGQNDIINRDYYAGNISFDKAKQTIDPNLNYLTRDMSDEQRTATKQDYYSKLHIGYAEKVATADPLAAKAYLEQNKGDMNPMLLEGAVVSLNEMQRKRQVDADRINQKGGPEMDALYKSNLGMPYKEFLRVNLYDPKYDKMPKKEHDNLLKLQKEYVQNPQNELMYSQNAFIEKSLEEPFKKFQVSEEDGGWFWFDKKLEAETAQVVAMEKESLKKWLKEKPRTQDELNAKVQEVKARVEKPIYLAEYQRRISNPLSTTVKQGSNIDPNHAMMQFLQAKGYNLDKYKKPQDKNNE